jgi:hypothetical protein
MKKIFMIAATLVALVGMSIISASAASASVCEGNGISCTASGTYSGLNALINSNYAGFQVVWTSSSVPPYSTIPSPWTVYITYSNVTFSSLTLGCPGNWSDPAYVSAQYSGGSGDDGGITAASTTCSQNPGLNVTVPPGGTYTAFATFGNVPWPGSTVAVQWGDAGRSRSVIPWTCPQNSSSPWAGYIVCGVNAASVSARWAVPPAIQKGNANTGAGFWVGLGGTTANLEQAGTASDIVNRRPVYFAFYELTPADPVRLQEPVKPGDIISATVSLTNGDEYNFTLTNYGPSGRTSKWIFTQTVTDSEGGHNSAEAIAEDSGGVPGLPPGCLLTDFSTVAFSGINIDGYTIGSYQPSVIQMVDNKVSLSSLRADTAYTVYFEHS